MSFSPISEEFRWLIQSLSTAHAHMLIIEKCITQGFMTLNHSLGEGSSTSYGQSDVSRTLQI